MLPPDSCISSETGECVQRNSSSSTEASEPLGLLQPELRKKILCVGLCRTDIIQICREFPDEFEELDCVDCRWQRGGNASNTCTVLAQFDVEVEFLGTLSAEEPRLHDLIGDMDEHRIDHSHCRTIPNTTSPISSILVNQSNLSRTIWNYNPNLPELTIKEFQRLDLNDYGWIHFEGRNVNNVVQMMQTISLHNTTMRELGDERLVPNPIVISIEVNKEIPGIYELLPFADVIFIGENFLHTKGYENMTNTLDHMAHFELKPGAIIICAFDERGALGRAPNGERIQCPAQPSRPIVDIFGASDTFNAAMIYFLYQENISTRDLWNDSEHGQINFDTPCPLEFIDPGILYQALVFACRTSGAKMGFRGFRDLAAVYERLTIHREITL